MLLDNNLLLSLAQVCGSFTGFIGIVVVLGRRSSGEWKAADDVRFRTLITSSLAPFALTLFPVLFGPNSFAAIGLSVGGIAMVLIIKDSFLAIRLPEGNTRLAVVIATMTVLVFGNLILCVLGVVPVALHKSYLALILWNLSVSVLFFIRLLRSTRIQH